MSRPHSKLSLTFLTEENKMQIISYLKFQLFFTFKNNLKLYIYDRDSKIGDQVYSSLISAIESSRNIIIVLSNSFLKSQFCRGQAEIAGE